jgi:putative membrane protein
VPLLAFASLVAAGLAHLFGAQRLAARGVVWRRRRSALFAVGLLVIGVALCSPLAAHDEDVRVHVLQHLLLGMLGPLLLALSAPVTLLLRVLAPPRRGRVARLLHSPAARVLIHPLVAGALSVGPMYVLYFTPLYQATLRSEPLHEIVHLHMLLAGCLLAWSLVGPDPVPYRPALRLRSVALIGTLAAHAILSKLLYAHGAPLADAETTASDWRQAAQILWYGGDAVDLGLLVAFFGQWYALGGRRLERLRALT